MIPAEEALAFIWSGQEGLAEMVFDFSARCHFHPDEALHVLPDYRCFGPILRSRPASTKDAVATTANVVWADIDSRNAPNLIDSRLRRHLGIEPSVIVDSGNKGFWAYLKLDQSIPTGEVELLNKRLGLLLHGDHSWNRDRLARLPGSIHPQSGRRAEVVGFSAVVHDPERLTEALPELPALDLGPSEDVSDEGDAGIVVVPEWPILPDWLWEYVKKRPKRGEGYDRSAVEYKIFLILIHRGWTTRQIVEFADQVRLPRHVYERVRRQNYGWTLHSIRNAREYIARSESSPTTHIHTPMCLETDTHKWLDRFSLLKIVDGLYVQDAIEGANEVLHASRSTVHRALNQLEEEGYLRRESHGRRRLIVLTEKGEDVLSRRYRPPIVVRRLDDREGLKGVVSR